MVGDIYLVDVIRHLHYLDDELEKDNSENLFKFLEKSKQNLLIDTELQGPKNN